MVYKWHPRNFKYHYNEYENIVQNSFSNFDKHYTNTEFVSKVSIYAAVSMHIASFSINVLPQNPPLSGLLDHAFPVLNHDQTDCNTKPVEYWCMARVAWSSYYCIS